MGTVGAHSRGRRTTYSNGREDILQFIHERNQTRVVDAYPTPRQVPCISEMADRGFGVLGQEMKRVLTNSQLGPPWSGDIMYSRAEGGTSEEEEQG